VYTNLVGISTESSSSPIVGEATDLLALSDSAEFVNIIQIAQRSRG
jgi:hypothetical protein